MASCITGAAAKNRTKQGGKGAGGNLPDAGGEYRVLPDLQQYDMIEALTRTRAAKINGRRTDGCDVFASPRRPASASHCRLDSPPC